MIGQTLGHSKSPRKLCKRGIGEVFLAEDTTLQRQGALEGWCSAGPERALSIQFRNGGSVDSSLSNHHRSLSLFKRGGREMSARVLSPVAVGLSLVLVGPLLLFGCGKPAAETGPTTNGETEREATFSYDRAEFPNAKPWKSESFKNDPDSFQFVVIGDRGGGANPQGTFEIAMDQLNLLQPEFVINVGDLIEGYTYERAEVDAEWDEAEDIIGKLEMPFFFVRGNHDVNFPPTKEAWKERFGPGYYHFVYKDALFIALDTEDAERPFPPNMEEDIKTYNRLKEEDPEKAGAWMKEWLSTPEAIEAFGHGAKVEFPQPQIDWLEKTLAENAGARWTFLFLHEPVWDKPSEGFLAMQKLLVGRPHTFFAGHVHYYDYDEIDGVEDITMGPAGAAFLGQEGPGNVDHILWVTMTDDSPQMGNIALKGIFDRKGLDPEMFGAYDRSGGPGSEGAH